VLSGDVRYVFAKLYFLEPQFAHSWTGTDGTSATGGNLWKIELDRTGRSFGFNWAINGVDDDFQADAGFVNRTGYINVHAFNRFSWYGATGALVESVSAFFTPNRLWNYRDFGNAEAIEGGVGGSVDVTLRGGWSVELEANRSFIRPDLDDYSGIEVATPSGTIAYDPIAHITGHRFGLSVATPTFRKFDASFDIAKGQGTIFQEGAPGNGFQTGFDVSLRATAQTRVTATAVYTSITRTRDDSEFARSLIPRIKAEYQATRHLFFRGILEYAAERQSALVDARTGAPLLRNGQPIAAQRDNGFRVDALVSYEPTPGTVAYVGYGSSYTEVPVFSSRFRRSEDGFFVKLAYQFRK
ncbi:MAG TPA: hypothetical protein VGD49_03050, partial [Longimicrobiales bacterium]